METDYSLQALMDFMDYLSNKHILNKNTAQSRKAAANKVFSVLDQSEVADLRKLDMDMVFRRFENKEAKSYKPETLQVYRSRLTSTLSDFFSHAQNPGQFKSSVKSGGSAQKTTKSTTSKSQGVKRGEVPDARGVDAIERITPARVGVLTVPVPLREGVTVQIIGLPVDLSEAEAARLAAIMTAYAMV